MALDDFDRALMAAQNAYRFWQNTWDNMYAQKKAA